MRSEKEMIEEKVRSEENSTDLKSKYKKKSVRRRKACSRISGNERRNMKRGYCGNARSAWVTEARLTDSDFSLDA